MKGLYVGEYSPSQDGFHVQRLVESLESNIERALRKDKSNDWVPLAVGRLEAVGKVVDAVRKGQAQLLKGGTNGE
jgi:hypothetical protein